MTKHQCRCGHGEYAHIHPHIHIGAGACAMQLIREGKAMRQPNGKPVVCQCPQYQEEVVINGQVHQRVL